MNIFYRTIVIKKYQRIVQIVIFLLNLNRSIVRLKKENMLNMKKILLPLLVLVTANLFAQGVLKFKSESHDFGVVEEGIQAVHTFDAINTGNQPVVISNVQASCGCTTPDWPTAPIMPGATAKIKASYNSQGRPGVFNKSITVTSNTAEPTKVLYIKGIVVKKDTNAVGYTEAQKKASPNATFEKTVYNFGKLEKGQKVSYKFKVTNTGMSELKISGILAGCGCVTYTISKESIKPKESAVLDLIYTPKSLGDIEDVVTITSNDIVNKNIQVKLKANVVNSLAQPNLMKEGGQKIGF